MALTPGDFAAPLYKTARPAPPACESTVRSFSLLPASQAELALKYSHCPAFDLCARSAASRQFRVQSPRPLPSVRKDP